MSFDLDALLERPDGECTVTLRGEELKVFVAAPGHLAFLEAQRAEQKLRALIDGSEEGEIPYGADDVSDHYAFVDEHILRLEDQHWGELPPKKRMHVLHSLSAKDFWGLVNEIARAGKLETEEGND